VRETTRRWPPVPLPLWLVAAAATLAACTGTPIGGGDGAGGAPGDGQTGGSSPGGATGGAPGAGGAASPVDTGGGGARPAMGGTGPLADPGCSDTVDRFAPSIRPPGDLAPERVPMFVLLGFDDNAYLDGLSWTLDFLGARRNPDGSPALATFFMTAGFVTDHFRPVGGQTKEQLLASWKRIATDGHEVANHTFSHGTHLSGADLATWTDEVSKAQDLLVEELGVERCFSGSTRAPSRPWRARASATTPASSSVTTGGRPRAATRASAPARSTAA